MLNFTLFKIKLRKKDLCSPLTLLCLDLVLNLWFFSRFLYRKLDIGPPPVVWGWVVSAFPENLLPIHFLSPCESNMWCNMFPNRGFISSQKIWHTHSLPNPLPFPESLSNPLPFPSFPFWKVVLTSSSSCHPNWKCTNVNHFLMDFLLRLWLCWSQKAFLSFYFFTVSFWIHYMMKQQLFLSGKTVNGILQPALWEK